MQEDTIQQNSAKQSNFLTFLERLQSALLVEQTSKSLQVKNIYRELIDPIEGIVLYQLVNPETVTEYKNKFIKTKLITEEEPTEEQQKIIAATVGKFRETIEKIATIQGLPVPCSLFDLSNTVNVAISELPEQDDYKNYAKELTTVLKFMNIEIQQQKINSLTLKAGGMDFLNFHFQKKIITYFNTEIKNQDDKIADLRNGLLNAYNDKEEQIHLLEEKEAILNPEGKKHVAALKTIINEYHSNMDIIKNTPDEKIIKAIKEKEEFTTFNEILKRNLEQYKNLGLHKKEENGQYRSRSNEQAFFKGVLGKERSVGKKGLDKNKEFLNQLGSLNSITTVIELIAKYCKENIITIFGKDVVVGEKKFKKFLMGSVLEGLGLTTKLIELDLMNEGSSNRKFGKMSSSLCNELMEIIRSNTKTDLQELTKLLKNSVDDKLQPKHQETKLTRLG